MTEKGLAKWLYKHCYDVDNNAINLYNLDFTPFNCNVVISGMKVNGDLFQGQQKANTIWQHNSEADEIIQNGHIAKKIYQDNLKEEE